jgi:hypothetical protein
VDYNVKIFLGILDGICRQFFPDIKIAVQKKEGYYFIAIKIPINLAREQLSGQRSLTKRRG